MAWNGFQLYGYSIGSMFGMYQTWILCMPDMDPVIMLHDYSTGIHRTKILTVFLDYYIILYPSLMANILLKNWTHAKKGK